MRAFIKTLAVLVLISILSTLPGCGRTHEVVLVQGFDISPSAVTLCKLIQKWTMQLYSLLDSDSWLMACRLSNENDPKINMRKGLPQPDEVAGPEFKALVSPGKDKGTRPLRFLEYSLALAKQYPRRLFVVVYFTDGENDYAEDIPALRAVCQDLIDQPNVVRVGLLGLNTLSAKSGADWNTWFHGSDKAIIATSTLGCTRQGINQLCSEVEKDYERTKESNQKGR